MDHKQPGLIVILGPTASGKSALALDMACHLNLPILNADSRQVYRGMDVGTAKATPEQQRLAPHYLLDLRDPDRPVTVREFQVLAQQCILRFHRRGTTPLLVGGSGLYLAAVTQGLRPPALPPQPVLRRQLTALGQPHCHGLLRCADPVAARSIHPNDKVRTQRALEVIYGTGCAHSLQQSRHPPAYPVLEIGLAPEDLRQRIHQRTAAMVAGGLLEETQRLMERFGVELPLLQTMGYREACQLLTGRMDRQQAVAAINRRTRHYAKRQFTWFRHQHQPHWLTSAQAQGWQTIPRDLRQNIVDLVRKPTDSAPTSA
ncbi:tRNA dimethylallyltransferase [Candidatus Synechococcus spongiarum LMB bulk10E]|uniref:tRNA dimethylallyltransferase n=3 Tax=Candidatus Synechococcus spongiarum TaxID=431041 RepID=A0A1T1CZZ1_9SYNE|nr:tRNA (adenosine(37)-N6)-dimethylallyltransferase MiaA [Candidatus Synechococcus spongiarum]KKZ14704.1 MAG: tRNA delta(2)-isopentenylpyrophosphate transferase [Candidatus Synechococcus spongiarum 15L]MCY4359808.1 tRNA (adenosine(37)-N6)-dimethylallyltransferase MiaA [Cyanobacteria bacterium MAG APA_bin_95]OOV34157.1 tRNA dimethylallyltransferase [Candidatus Synechococcus spongiarum LMB bulk15M]OOV34897.1 tRNA dimethylallyltransferase [Candidatus Synechococcus spongiarum LMB bulk10E]OOV36076.